MMKLELIRWGIIGVGDVCEVKSGPAFQKINHSTLVAVMRRDREKARDFAERHAVPKWYADADTLINDPDINAIYIATPPHMHLHYARKAAETGKAIYVEKPMAMTYQECLQMREACRSNSVPLFVAYYRRMLPNFIKVKELLDQGVIGDVRYVSIKLNQSIDPEVMADVDRRDNWRIIPEISGGGYFHDLACHQLDCLDYLLGPIKNAFGHSVNQAGLYVADDNTTASFEFENGVLGQGVWCFTTGQSSVEDRTTVVGSKGEISFPFFADHSVEVKIDGKKTDRLEFNMPENIQQPLIQTIVDELTGKGKCPSNGESAIRTAWVMDQIIN